jgi:pimeloyl-ACP methyl ester carboxylesterase
MPLLAAGAGGYLLRRQAFRWSATDDEIRPDPQTVQNGLAVYVFGEGEPLLLMPYPHAATVVGGRALTSLIEGLEAFGRKVVTFDPPGSGRSTRRMRLDMSEMLECAEEALGVCGVSKPVDVMGHSQGGFASLAFALQLPGRVRRLVLVAAGAGGPSWLGAQGAIWNSSHPDYWHFGLLSSVYLLTRRLAAQKLMYNLVFRDSYVERVRFAPSPIPLKDWVLPAHPRTRWALVARNLDYRPRLGEVSVPTLLLAGRHDPQMPPSCSEELDRGISETKLILFEKSGHYPFIEEPEAFWEVVRNFLEGS